jgi:single-strand DNA-binding protein
MASFNKVILMGNLTRDPEVRYIPSGTAVAEIGLAVNRSWYDKQAQQRKEEVTFVDVTLWGRQAEVAGEYLSKGRSVLIEGRLQLDSWQDKETGKNRSKLKVVGEQMTMVGGRGEQGGGGGRPAAGNSNRGGGSGFDDGPPGGGYDQGAPSAGGFQDSGPPDDEVPF